MSTTVPVVHDVPAIVAGLCDDAAVFPPGLAPLPDAVRAYRERQDTWYADLVGPLVLAAAALPSLGPLLVAGAAPLPLSVTLPGGPRDLPGVLAGCATLPVELRSVEVAVPAGLAPGDFLDELAAALPQDGAVEVYVEVPRDQARAAILDAVTSSAGRYRAKFRTGGVAAALYPDEAELAEALAAVVAGGVSFKATAGLHRAVRNTDQETGFEQHGFVNVLLATDALVRGAGAPEVRELLAERDGETVAGLVRDLDPRQVAAARAAFTSFGTCSILDPRDDLVTLAILAPPSPDGARR
ncbi:MAG: hypothetical protein L0H84_08500 [Pseudonocardia sp.]|nr:hypothetical protein [Pseudonocardia sp.]